MSHFSEAHAMKVGRLWNFFHILAAIDVVDFSDKKFYDAWLAAVTDINSVFHRP